MLKEHTRPTLSLWPSVRAKFDTLVCLQRWDRRRWGRPCRFTECVQRVLRTSRVCLANYRAQPSLPCRLILWIRFMGSQPHPVTYMIVRGCFPLRQTSSCDWDHLAWKISNIDDLALSRKCFPTLVSLLVSCIHLSVTEKGPLESPVTAVDLPIYLFLHLYQFCSVCWSYVITDSF